MTLWKQDRLFFWFCLVDMLFLPYFPLITVAYSMPVVYFWWMLRRKSVQKQAEYKLVMLAIVLILLTTIISYILYPANIKDNTVYLLEMSAVFLYYIMFKYYVDRYNVDIEKWLFAFVLFVGMFAVLYNIDRALYQSVKFIWNSRMSTVWSTTVFNGFRFGFIWMDENNIAYMINTIAFFLIVSKRLSVLQKFIVFGINLLVVVSTMSSGGRISLILVWGAYLVYVLTHIRVIRNPFKRYVRLSTLLSVLLVVVLIFVSLQYVIPRFSNSTIYLESQERTSENSMDSRLQIWTSVAEGAKWWQCVFWGSGGRTMVAGVPRAPHNGHFYWILSYGMIVYYIYIYIFFRKRKGVSYKNWVAILPFFLGFSINTMIGEPKVNEIIAVLVAYMSSPLYCVRRSKSAT